MCFLSGDHKILYQTWSIMNSTSRRPLHCLHSQGLTRVNTEENKWSCLGNFRHANENWKFLVQNCGYGLEGSWWWNHHGGWPIHLIISFGFDSFLLLQTPRRSECPIGYCEKLTLFHNQIPEHRALNHTLSIVFKFSWCEACLVPICIVVEE